MVYGSQRETGSSLPKLCSPVIVLYSVSDFFLPALLACIISVCMVLGVFYGASLRVLDFLISLLVSFSFSQAVSAKNFSRIHLEFLWISVAALRLDWIVFGAWLHEYNWLYTYTCVCISIKKLFYSMPSCSAFQFGVYSLLDL